MSGKSNQGNQGNLWNNLMTQVKPSAPSQQPPLNAGFQSQNNMQLPFGGGMGQQGPMFPQGPQAPPSPQTSMFPPHAPMFPQHFPNTPPMSAAMPASPFFPRMAGMGSNPQTSFSPNNVNGNGTSMPSFF